MTYADLDEAKVRDFLRRRQEAYPGTTLPGAPLVQVVAEMLEGARERDGEPMPTYTGLLYLLNIVGQTFQSATWTG